MIHHVYANQSNIGDWLSARGIQSLLAPWPVQEHFCDEPFVAHTLAALAATGPEDLIIIGGGGLFMDYFAPFWKGFRPMAARARFCLWGVGYCDMKREPTRPPRKLITEIVRRSQLCVVRDELTGARLRACRLPPSVPCPTMNAVTPQGGAQRRLLHVDHYDNVGPRIYERMVAMAEEFAAQTGRSYRQTNNLISAGNRAALKAALALYASADRILTSRLHGCIIALALGRPVLAVSGDRKMESFMRAAGLGEWVCDLDEIDALPERLAALGTQPVPTAFIEQARQRNRAVADQIRQLLRPGQAIGAP
jgi:polysaccharide pyruvyl transferase WcaK-like protein